MSHLHFTIPVDETSEEEEPELLRGLTPVDPFDVQEWDAAPRASVATLLALLDPDAGEDVADSQRTISAAVLNRLRPLEVNALAMAEDFVFAMRPELRKPDEEMVAGVNEVLSACCVAFEAAPGKDPLGPAAAQKRFGELSRLSERRVCQYAFKRNDIVWICKECQADETCVLCNDCFIDSEHEGHEVYFYHAQAGGCCDCGDPYAWNPQGCCTRHGRSQADPLSALPPAFVQSTGEVVRTCIAFVAHYARHERLSHELVRRDVDFAALPGAWSRFEGDLFFCQLLQDEIHTEEQVKDALRDISAPPGSLFQTPSEAIRELQTVAGFLVVHRGDLAAVRKTAAILARPRPASRRDFSLRQRGFIAAAITKALLQMRLVAMAILQWLHHAAELSDGVCRLVAREFGADVLADLFDMDPYLVRPVKEALNALYLHLMSDAPFKRLLASAYARSFPRITTAFQRGLGLIDASVYSLSVQFLNRAMFVAALRHEKDFFRVLAASFYRSLLFASDESFARSMRMSEPSSGASGMLPRLKAFLEIFEVSDAGAHTDAMHSEPQAPWSSAEGVFEAVGADMEHWVDPLFDEKSRGRFVLADALASPQPRHWVLRFRRYIPIMSDLKCILTVPGMATCFWGDAGHWWLRSLALTHGVHAQARQMGRHVEYEDENWMFAFNLLISINSCFEGILSWLGERNPQRAPQPEGQPLSEAEPSCPPDIDTDLLCRLTAAAKGVGGPAASQALYSYMRDVEKASYGRSASAVQCLCSIATALGTHQFALAHAGRRPFAAVPPLVATKDAEGRYTRPWLCVGAPLPRQSFHIPLYRFWAAALRQAARVSNVDTDIAAACLPQLGEGKEGDWETLLKDSSGALLTGLCAIAALGRWEVTLAAPGVGGGRPPPGLEGEALAAWEAHGAYRGEYEAGGNGCGKSLVGDIIDEVSRVLAMAAQVASGMWRRNGVAIADQVNNYGDGPFFRIFRDLDLMAIQFAAVLYGPDALLGHLCHRFGFFTALGGKGGGGSSDLSPADLEFAPPLLEVLLMIIIVLVTELPPPPDSESTQADGMAALRREMVHKLVTSNRTHSELADCAAVLFRSEPLAPEVVAGIIDEITVEKRDDDVLAAVKYELRPALWAEYDPCYFHLTMQDHQMALAKRPQPKKPMPLCASPPRCHPLFGAWRGRLLRCDSVFLIIHEILKHTGAASDAPVEHTIPDAPAAVKLYSESLVLRCLQIVTLGLHMDAPENADLDGSNSTAAQLAAFRGGELLRLLGQLPDVLDDAHARTAAQWIRRRLRQNARCQEILGGTEAEGEPGTGKKAKKKSRGKLAQQRAAERMKQRALDFAQQYGGADEEDEAGSEEEVEDDEADECIICRDRIPEPLHSVAFVERARVLSHHPRTHFGRGQREGAEDQASPQVAPRCPGEIGAFSREANFGAGLFLQSCGHSLHLSCFRQYYLTGASHRAAHSLLAGKGEFSCPLCQQLSNILVPHHAVEKWEPAKDGANVTSTPTSGCDFVQVTLPEWSALPAAPKSDADLASSETPPRLLPPPIRIEAGGWEVSAPYAPIVPPGPGESGSASSYAAPLSPPQSPAPLPDLSKDAAALSRRFLTSLWAVWQDEPSLPEPAPSEVPLSEIPLMAVPTLSPPVALGAVSLVAYTIKALEAEFDVADLLSPFSGSQASATLGTRNPGLALQKRMRHTASALRSVRASLQVLGPAFRAKIFHLVHARLVPQQADPGEDDVVWCDAGHAPTTLLEDPSGLLLAMLCAIEAPELQVVRLAVAATWQLRLWQVVVADLREGVTGQASRTSPRGESFALGDDEGAGEPSAVLHLFRTVARETCNTTDVCIVCPPENLKALEHLVARAQRAHLRVAALMVGWLWPDQVGDARLIQDPDGYFELPSPASWVQDAAGLTLSRSWWSEAIVHGNLRRLQGRDVWPGEREPLKVIVAAGLLAGVRHPALISLPSDYTELHAQFSSTVRQALCLVCGELMVVDGSGQASAHAVDCGCGQGIFYLIREGNVLLVHGSKAAYFPSPYVDSYGERQRKFRTIPLKLEPRRWEAVQRLWAQHGIAIEVAHQRATARQVIVDSWY